MVPAFQWAILLLLAVPFALVGTVALLIYRASRSQSEPTEARGATH